MSEVYKAHCFDGTHRMPPVTLNGVDEVKQYVTTQMEIGIFPEIVVVDQNDMTVLKVENHKIVWPEGVETI